MLDLPLALSAPGAGVDVATGVALVAAGVVAWRRARGPLLLLAGLAWLAGDVWDPLVYAHRGPLTQLLLGLSPVSAVAYIDGLVAPVARAPWPTLALAAAILAVAAWRRRPWPLLAATAICGPLVFEAIADLRGATSDGAAVWWYDAAVAATAVALALPQRRGAAATGLVVDLATTPQALRAALARAVGDPGLEIAYRVGGNWVDEAARPVELPAGDAERVVSIVDAAGEPIAALVHDRAALQDEALARSVAAALRLTLANVRLQADVAARVREVELSRRRLVEAGAAERRRLREQLRAGAELHLQGAAAELDATGDPALAALRDELAAGRADLRRFAQGIHPRALTQEGLEPALRELTAQSAASIELDVPQRRFPAPQETVAYFVCSEALANAAKHAPGARVRVAVGEHRGRLVVRVEDDGPGGAEAASGSGLRGLADRVEAFSGRLTVHSEAGSGTVLTAELPLPSEVAA